MNSCANKTECDTKKKFGIAPILFFVICTVLLIYKQDVVKEAVAGALKLCASSIIPAVFPFVILSDYLTSNISMRHDTALGGIFKKALSINPVGVVALVIGNICGFPLGALITDKFYKNGIITKDEYNRLIPLSTNPSLAFVVCGVGGMRSSVEDGIILYFSVILGTLISGIIWSIGKSASHYNMVLQETPFSLSESVKAATQSAIYITAYITFFSIIVSLLSSLRLPLFITLALASILEIGNASYLLTSHQLHTVISMPSLAFSLAFSGISIYMQTISFISSSIDTRYYFKIKITGGILAAIISFLCVIILR